MVKKIAMKQAEAKLAQVRQAQAAAKLDKVKLPLAATQLALLNKPDTYDLAIIGAGAAGLFTCALIELICQGQLKTALARPYVEDAIKPIWQGLVELKADFANLKIVLIEGQATAGKKLALTGGGRCNLASNLPTSELITKYHEAFNFLRPTWQGFSPNLLRSLLFSMGISTYWDEQGRLYPQTNSAKSVRDQLLAYASQNANLTIAYQCQIQSIKEPETSDDALLLTSHKQEFRAKKLIIATGGYSVPATGSNGELANFLAQKETFACSLVTPKAALAPLIWQKEQAFPLKDLSGISLNEVELNLEYEVSADIKKQLQRRFGRRLKFTSSGDLLITKNGLSGPAALNLARFFCKEATSNKLSVNFLNEAHLNSLATLFSKHVKAKSQQTVSKFLQNNVKLPLRLVNYLLESKIQYAKRYLYTLTANEQAEILSIFTWQTNSLLAASLKQAQASCGGIALNCLNPQTLALKNMPNCFLLGEIMNVDACCGGFNLLHAFATSSLVVRNIF